MKIGIVSWESLHSVAVGGIAAHVTEMAAALARIGDEVHVVTRMGEGQGSYEEIDGVHYHRCAYDPRPDFVEDVNSMCGAFVDRIFQIEDDTGPLDVVHGHDWLTTKAAVWARQGRGKRVVMTIHSTEYGRCGNYFHEGGSRRVRDYEWEAQYNADAVVAVSNVLKDEIVRIYSTPREKIHTIYNGVEVHRFDGWIDQGLVKTRCGIGPLDPMVLFVGRMAYQKGPDLLIQAIPEVLRAHPRARFVLVGDGDMRWHLEEQVRDRGLGGSIRFLGQRRGEELADIYRAADLVAVPSRNEPFGIVILEAWSAGKPVVVTHNGGPEEFVWDGVTGVKSPANPADISVSIGSLLDRPDYARWIGHNGRVAVETAFSWERIAERIRDVYRTVS